jgi:FMN reductase
MTESELTTPLILGFGGGAGARSATDQALSIALAQARRHGARTLIFSGHDLAALPLYMTAQAQGSAMGAALIDAVRRANGLIIASPGYHGCISGIVKNAIDYVEETCKDPRPYLTDLPVGLIAVAGGHQAAVSTLWALRTVAHALRAWPTPFGAAICSFPDLFCDGVCSDADIQTQLARVGTQVAQFAQRMESHHRRATMTTLAERRADFFRADLSL